MENKRKGFTLVELLLVISVICLMMAILMPALSKARELAKRAVCANQLRQIGVAVHTYTGRYDGFLLWWGYTGPGLYEGSENMQPYVAYRNDEIDWIDLTSLNLKPMKLACLYEGGFLEDAKVFYCPSNRSALYKYESYVDPPPWGTLPQNYNTRDQNGNSHNQWVRVGYIYYPTDPKSEKLTGSFMDYPRYVEKKMDRLDSRIPYMADMIRNNTAEPREELSHKTPNTYGLHVMFSDGHVTFCKDNYVFDDPIWFGGVATWREFYYRVFNLVAEVE